MHWWVTRTWIPLAVAEPCLFSLQISCCVFMYTLKTAMKSQNILGISFLMLQSDVAYQHPNYIILFSGDLVKILCWGVSNGNSQRLWTCSLLNHGPQSFSKDEYSCQRIVETATVSIGHSLFLCISQNMPQSPSSRGVQKQTIKQTRASSPAFWCRSFSKSLKSKVSESQPCSLESQIYILGVRMQLCHKSLNLMVHGPCCISTTFFPT